MKTPFNLIKNEEAEVEQRVLPRFPLNLMTFKADQYEGHIFEVRDISFKGMQIELKVTDGPNFSEGDVITGSLIWGGKKLKLKGFVKWASERRFGIFFDATNGLGSEIRSFLSVDQLANRMRPLHTGLFELELPTNLKYWLKSDGPAELFVWQHRDGELARFQFILMDKWIEWQDGEGVKTGKVIGQRDLDTPLQFEEEFNFNIDEYPDIEALQMARDIVARIPKANLPGDAAEFLGLKLSG